MDRIDEILSLYEDDRVEMKDGGRSLPQEPKISKTELTKLSKKLTQKEIAQKTGFSIATVQRLFQRFGLKSVYKPGGYRGAVSEARIELEKKLFSLELLVL